MIALTYFLSARSVKAALAFVGIVILFALVLTVPSIIASALFGSVTVIAKGAVIGGVLLAPLKLLPVLTAVL